MADFSAFVTGLAGGINKYMQMDQVNKNEQANARNKMSMEMQLEQFKGQIQAQNQKSQQDNELNREKALEAYKQSLGGQVDPDTANSIDPSYGDIATNFQTKNGRSPTVHELHDMASLSKSGQGVQMVDPNTLSSLAKTMGADDNVVAQLGAIGKPMPTGLATEALKNIFDKGLGDKEIFGLYKEMNPVAEGKSPDQLGEDWQKFKIGMTEPGKTPIVTDQQFNQTLQSAEGFMKQQMANGASYSQALAGAAQKASGYDRKSKAKLMFRVAADVKQSQAQQQQAPRPGLVNPIQQQQ